MGNPINRKNPFKFIRISTTCFVLFRLLSVVQNGFLLAQLLTVCVHPLTDRVDVPTPRRTSTTPFRSYDPALATRLDTECRTHTAGAEQFGKRSRTVRTLTSRELHDFQFFSTILFFPDVFLLSLLRCRGCLNEFCTGIAFFTDMSPQQG